MKDFFRCTVQLLTYWVASKHVDGVALLEEAVGNQRLSSGIGSADIRVIEDRDELADNVVGVGLSEAVVRGA